MLFVKNLIFLEALLMAGLFLFREALHPRYRSIINFKLFLLKAAAPEVGLFGGTP